MHEYGKSVNWLGSLNEYEKNCSYIDFSAAAVAAAVAVAATAVAAAVIAAVTVAVADAVAVDRATRATQSMVYCGISIQQQQSFCNDMTMMAMISS